MSGAVRTELVVAWLVAWLVSAALAGTPSVHYITHGIFGNFFVAPGWGLNSSDAFKIFPTTNNCTCHRACWSHTRCRAAAAVVTAEGVQCRMADKGPMTRHAITDSHGTYYYWEDDLPVDKVSYGLEKDNLLYLRMGKLKYSLNATVDLCNMLPGHRLPITKSVKQYTNLLDMAAADGAEYWVDMYRVGETGPMTWGDGMLFANCPASSVASTPVQDHETEPLAYFRIKDGKFDDRPLEDDKAALCQANPFGIDW